MHSDNSLLIEIVEKSSSLHERLSNKFITNGYLKDDTFIKSKIEKWQALVAQNDPQKFQSRLRLDQWDMNTVCSALAPVRLANKESLPEWTTTLREALAACEMILDKIKRNQLHEYGFLNANKPKPFQEVFLPFMHIARERVRTRTASITRLFSQKAHLALEESLMRRLIVICSRALVLEFSVFRACRQSWFSAHDSSGSALYDEFVTEMLSSKLPMFLREYSVLARIVANVIDMWVNSSVEFMHRLSADWPEIQQVYGGHEKPGKVINLQTDISDPHNFGRSAIIVTFLSGVRLVYKPKDLGMDVAFFDLLSWLNRQTLSVRFKTLKVINRDAYGWLEFLERKSCENAEQLSQYYRRAGALLCLVYILEGTDCHHENIIAHGEHPVLIDLETLFHPLAREENDGLGGAQMLASKRIYHSVLRTGMLPQWQLGPMGESYDISGMGGNGQAARHRGLVWKNINTDRMSLKYEMVETQMRHNLPSFDQKALSAADFLHEITFGFREIYQLFMKHKNNLLASNGPLAKFKKPRVRFVFRPTEIYNTLLEISLNPGYLRDGADRSIQLDALSRAILTMNDYDSFWPILKAEQEALERMDIPHFVSYPTSSILTAPTGETLTDIFEMPSFEVVKIGIEKLSQDDLEEQLGFIKGAFASQVGSQSNGNGAVSTPRQTSFDTMRMPSKKELRHCTLKLADELQQLAITSRDGTATWIAPCFEARTERYQLKQLATGLYDGTTGIALFFSALYKITGNQKDKKFAFAALKHTRSVLNNQDWRDFLIRAIGISGATGCASIVYALVRCSQFLSDDSLLDDAKKAADLITFERIKKDEDLDVIFGVAGAILGLLALYDRTHDSELLQKMMLCGEHLLEKRITSNSGHQAWKTKLGVATGFSHGAAGIAYALLRLFQASGNDEFKEAACEAIRFEKQAFVQKTGNWPKLPEAHDNDPEQAWCSWCHGATGIGLARLGTIEILNTKEIRQDISAAIETTRQREIHATDNVCCGNMGRVEFLLTAATKLSEQELRQTALKKTAQVLARAEQAGGFAIASWENGPMNPGFFQGGAGVGYVLLRLAYPDELPSVLAWE